MNTEVYKILRKAKISKWMTWDDAMLIMMMWNEKLLQIFLDKIKKALDKWKLSEKEYETIVSLVNKGKGNVIKAQNDFNKNIKKANNECMSDFIATEKNKLESDNKYLDDIEKALDQFIKK